MPSDLHPWLIGVIVLGGLLLAVEGGFWIGNRQRSRIDQQGKGNVTTGEAALLGLLALLITFSFSMSSSRFDARRALLLDEVNAIETASLRARLLPEPHRTEVAALLREYVDVRLDFYAAGIDREKLRQVLDRTTQIHNRLWDHAVAVGEQDQRAVTTGLFIESMNHVIDTHTKRWAAMTSRVPLPISMMLVFVAMAAVGFMGYSAGMAGRRNLIVTTTMSLLVAIVITVIVDLNRPRQGFIGYSQQSMIDLRDNMKSASFGK